MALDAELIKWLNLLLGSPNFTIRIDKNSNKGAVRNPPVVPNDDGVYWVFGTTILASGEKIKSVFVVDTCLGGTVNATYWHTGTVWIDSQNTSAPALLGIERNDMYPYDWEYAVPLEKDVFRP